MPRSPWWRTGAPDRRTASARTQAIGASGSGGGPTSPVGGQGDDAAAADAPVFRLATQPDGSHAFDHNRHTASGDKILPHFQNDSGIPYDRVLERDGRIVGRTQVITPGEIRALVTGLAPDRYTFCSIGGHRSDGMEGVLEMAGD